MFNVGGGEMIFLAILALLVFGPEGLPGVVKTVTRTVRAFRQAANDFQTEVNTALSLEHEKQQISERRRRRVAPRQQAAPDQSPPQAVSEERPPVLQAPSEGEPSPPPLVSADGPPPVLLTPGESEPPSDLTPESLKAPVAAALPVSLGADPSNGVVSEDSLERPASEGRRLSGDDAAPEQPLYADGDDDAPGLPMARAAGKTDPDTDNADSALPGQPDLEKVL